MGLIAAYGVIVATLALSAIWRGYVLTVLWGWFVVQTFGLPSLSIAPAVGLSLVVSFLTYQNDAATKQDGDLSERAIRAVTYALLMPLFVLGIGWVVHQFMP